VSVILHIGGPLVLRSSTLLLLRLLSFWVWHRVVLSASIKASEKSVVTMCRVEEKAAVKGSGRRN